MIKLKFVISTRLKISTSGCQNVNLVHANSWLHMEHILCYFSVSTGSSELNWKRINISTLYHYKANMKSECPKIVLALSAIIIVTYSVTIICLPRKSHYKLLSTDESKVTFYLDAMSWGDITPSLCLHMSVKSSTELMLF